MVSEYFGAPGISVTEYSWLPCTYKITLALGKVAAGLGDPPRRRRLRRRRRRPPHPARSSRRRWLRPRSDAASRFVNYMLFC